VLVKNVNELKMDLEALQEICVEGLCTDGGHHKQWYLEKILKKLMEPSVFEKLRKHLDWEGGIAP